ncbi:MAG: hypothetical protein ACD_58C00306G0001 [uncultured bacterium]|nr:MAG: hypothetical protein ACD_58C00306G0001 [uncultured bacterium]
MLINGISDNRSISNAVKVTLRRKFNYKKQKAEELKGSKSSQNIKEYFFKRINGINFAIYSITLNKIRVYERLRKDKERVYNFITRKVLDQIPFNKATSRVEIIIDKSKTKKNIFEFNQYIIRQIKTKFDLKIPFNIFHYDSKQNSGLQAVDMFCWGIFRKYEENDKVWYNVFKDKIVYDNQYL